MELPPGLVELQKQNETAIKAAKRERRKQKKRHERDVSPEHEPVNSKFTKREKPKLNREATFRLYSQRKRGFISDKCTMAGKRKLVFELPKRFVPRFEHAETKKSVGYQDDTLWVYQIVDERPEKLYRFDLTEINAIEDPDWTMLEQSEVSGSSDEDSSEYEPENFKAFLARTTDTKLTIEHAGVDQQHWTFEVAVDRKKHRFLLKKAILTLQKEAY